MPENKRGNWPRLPIRLFAIGAAAFCVIFIAAWLGLVFWAKLVLSNAVPSPEARAVLRKVLHTRQAIPPEWRDPQPFRPETLAAFEEFLLQARLAQTAFNTSSTLSATAPAAGYPSLGGGAPREDPCMQSLWALDSPLNREALTPERLTSATLCVECFAPAFQALKRLIAMPDFSPDIQNSLSPLKATTQERSALSSYISFRLHLQYCATAVRDVAEGTSEALSAYEAFRLAEPRTMAYYGQCSSGMRNALELIPVFVAWRGDRQLALEAIARLNASPPIPYLEWPPTPEREVYNWAFGYAISNLRELKRIGCPVDLSREMSGRELFQTVNRATDGYPEWMRRILPAGDPRLALLPELSYHDDDSCADYSILRFLRAVNLGPWSACGWEINYVYVHDSQLGHTFPLGSSVAACRAGAPVDMRRVSYDLALLNLAAFVCHADTGNWPKTPADLVPAYLSEEPPSPGPRGPYVWSVSLHCFVLRDPPESFAIL
jgi:hypothetical protein